MRIFRHTRFTSRARVLVALLAASGLGAWIALSGGRPSPRRLTAVASMVVDAPIRRWRAWTTADLPWLDGLAASQVGYAPAAVKRFTASRPFSAIDVLDRNSGVRIWHGDGPGRAVPAATVTSTETLWEGTFTGLQRPGDYILQTDTGLTSHPFRIGVEVYDDAIRAVQRAFYFQRAFTAIDAAHAEGPWTHPDDSRRAPTGVRHGWHDAGDYSLYNMTAASSLFWLLEAVHDFAPLADDTNIPESHNGVPDLLDEARWELDWLLSVQASDGGVRNSTCLATYAAYGDNPLERGAPYMAGEVGTVATARAVGVFAYAAALFAAYDAPYAGQLREAAQRGWQYLEAHPDDRSDGPTCPAYRQDGDPQVDRAVRQFAAAGLLVVTGEPAFRDAFERLASDIDGDPSPYRFAAYASLLYLHAEAADPAQVERIRAQLNRHAVRARADGDAHPFGFSGRPVWGSLAAGLERTAGFNVKGCLADRAARAADCTQALANIDYLFGRNGYRLAYVSGLPGITRGRQHAFHHWLATLRATPFLFPGLVAGGPNADPDAADGSRPHAWPMVWGYWDDPAMPRDRTTPLEARYTDNDSWSTNEVDIGWQAVTLYHLYFARWYARETR